MYKFIVKEGQNANFETAWKEVTLLIRNHCGSLGSRLYKSAENSYLGIAQWPDKETLEKSDISLLDPENWRAKMRESCEKIEKLDEIELIHDLWLKKPFEIQA